MLSLLLFVRGFACSIAVRFLEAPFYFVADLLIAHFDVVYLHFLVLCWSWSRPGHAPTETTDRPTVTQQLEKRGQVERISGEDKKTRGHV